MWDLFFRLRADGTNLNRDVGKAGAVFDTWASKQSKKMGETFWKGVSLATVGSIIVGGIRSISAMNTEAQRLALQFDMSAQAMIGLKRLAEETGQSIEEMVKQLKNGGPASKAIRQELNNLKIPYEEKWLAAFSMGRENWRFMTDALKYVGAFLGTVPVAVFSEIINFTKAVGGTAGLAAQGKFREAYFEMRNYKDLMMQPEKQWQRLKAQREKARIPGEGLPSGGSMSEIDDFAKRLQEQNEWIADVNRTLEENRAKARDRRIAELDSIRTRPAYADSLEAAGLFNAASANAQRQYERDSLTFLRKISENTLPKAGFETSIPPVDPYELI